MFHDHVFIGFADEEFSLVQVGARHGSCTRTHTPTRLRIFVPQHKTKLFLINVPKVTQAFFYQQVPYFLPQPHTPSPGAVLTHTHVPLVFGQMIDQFGRARRMSLSSPAPIEELVFFALESVTFLPFWLPFPLPTFDFRFRIPTNKGTTMSTRRLEH